MEEELARSQSVVQAYLAMLASATPHAHQEVSKLLDPYAGESVPQELLNAVEPFVPTHNQSAKNTPWISQRVSPTVLKLFFSKSQKKEYQT